MRADLHRPLVVAHRGSSGTAPENTIAAFREAVRAAADIVELDVRMSRDFELVVMHDRRVDRTTNGSGCVWDYTLEEIAALDAGRWFSPRFKGEQVPSLRAVMRMLPLPVGLNIEAKTDGDTRANTALAESLILHIREARMERRTMVSSFDHAFLRRLHRIDPEIAIGVLYYPLRDFGRSPSVLARGTGAVTFVCSRSQLRKRHVADAHAHGMSVACYTVDTVRQARALRKAGVDALITNYPQRILTSLSALR